MDLAGRRVVVTGGAGFIGSHVVDRLVEVGADVVAVDDLSVGERENLDAALGRGAELLVGDVRDRGFMEGVVADADVVLHMACDNLRASLGDPERTHEVNATGTLVTALAAARKGVGRLVYVSSSEAYGSGLSGRMGEDHPLLPTTVYGASKAAGELYAQSIMRTYGTEVTVVRPFNSFGPREHATGNSAEVIPKFATRIRAGLQPVIFGDGSQTRDFTWVEETAAGIVDAAACDAACGTALNIAYGTNVTIREIAELLLDIMDAGELGIQYDAARPGDVAHHWADLSRARELIGWDPKVAVREGLERYVDWLVEHEPAHAEAELASRNW